MQGFCLILGLQLLLSNNGVVMCNHSNIRITLYGEEINTDLNVSHNITTGKDVTRARASETTANRYGQDCHSGKNINFIIRIQGVIFDYFLNMFDMIHIFSARHICNRWMGIWQTIQTLFNRYALPRGFQCIRHILFKCS